MISVEGQTEYTFVGQVLTPHLQGKGVHPRTSIVTTKRVAGGQNFKGGSVTWAKLRRELSTLCASRHFVGITTMYDYYALAHDVPGMADRPPDSKRAVQHVERAVADAIGDRRFRCYLSLHEFEALLFTDPDECGGYLGSTSLADAMRRALDSCGAPELVDDHPTTAPSRRILDSFPGYAKLQDGPTLAERITLPRLRAACPHFGEWVDWLESLAG